MPTHHEINVTFSGGHAVPAIPPPPAMSVGDTVHYSSGAGTVTILFVENGTPFTDANGHEMTVITSAAPPLPLSKPSNSTPNGFTCRCFVTLPNGTTVGWGPNSPQSGGNHVVK